MPGSGFGMGLAKLVDALNTILDWLREHTRYLRLAKEWEEVGKPSDRRLLTAADIALAKAWAESRPAKAPEIASLQLEFIEASETENERRRSAEAQLLREVDQARDARVEALIEREKPQNRAKAGAAGGGDALNVFISYSRDDLDFADQLEAGLGLAGFETSLDRHGISVGEEWKKRLGTLIRGADTVGFGSPLRRPVPRCARGAGRGS